MPAILLCYGEYQCCYRRFIHQMQIRSFQMRKMTLKRKFSIGKLLSIIEILILCAGLIFSGIDLITTSSTVYRIIIAIITEVVALVFIFK